MINPDNPNFRTSRKEFFLRAMKNLGESFDDVEHCGVSDEDLSSHDRLISRRETEEGDFLENGNCIWTKNYVYFISSDEWGMYISGAPRNPPSSP